jgi:hypothetical protein
MSRFHDYDSDDEFAFLDYGRWQRNARAVLKSKRGRKALAELREALMALPEHRLIANAFCTVGGAAQRMPDLAEIDVARHRQDMYNALKDHQPPEEAAERAREFATRMRRTREQERADLAVIIEPQGEGVCVNAAYAWYRKVKEGMDPAEAFGSLPTIYEGDPDSSGDEIGDTAAEGEKAGLTFTLAWELAYRNDETYRAMTPEKRWEAFIEWIDRELAEPAA